MNDTSNTELDAQEGYKKGYIDAKLDKKGGFVVASERPKTQIEAMEQWRKSYGMNQGEFAKALGIAGSHYSEFKLGRRRLTHRAMHNAYKLGVPVEILLGYPPTVPNPARPRKRDEM